MSDPILSELKTKLPDLIRRLEQIVPTACALYKKSSGTTIRVNRLQESVEPQDPAQGLVVTLWNGQSFFEYAFNRWEWPALEADLINRAKTAAASVDKTRPCSEIDPGPPLAKDFFTKVVQPPSAVSLNDRLAEARKRLNTALAIDPQVVNALSLLEDVTQEDLYVNRNKILFQTLTRVEIIMVVFVSDGSKVTQVHQGTCKNGGLEAVRFSDDEIRAMVADGKKLNAAERLSPGLFDVVTDPEWSGIIAHECFGHGMETDLYVRGRAKSQEFIGKSVASSIVNMFDDPSAVTEAGGFFFDDEGQLASPTHIIKNGILQRGLTDLASAHKLKLERSANGRREGFDRKAYARMTNTFFGNGASSKEEIIASVKDGLYLRHATNGMEDPQAWGIQVEGLWAEEIKNGKLTGTVYSPVIMTGFVPDLLSSITMVGNDCFISGLGMCGKGHKEWIKNTTGGPHLKMTARLA